MKSLKKILLLTTGGTIASLPGGEGLEPRDSHVLHREISYLRNFFHVTVEDLMCLDSSNIRPEEWQMIARRIFHSRNDYDGVVVSHGTDTMAYTASAVSFMLENINVPVVFTGSQLPLPELLSDGPDNLRAAFSMAASGHPGVFLCFDRKVMLGCRAVKVRASDFNAFESVNARYVATANAVGLRLDEHTVLPGGGEPRLLDRLCTDVFLLKLTPGLSPRIFRVLSELGYRGIVIEAFGLGGINVMNEGLSGIRQAVDQGISIVVTTQCLYDSADLQVYQVGKRLLEMGVIQGRDMTTEAAMTKLMWALGQGYSQKEIAELFARSLRGEITEIKEGE